MTANMIWEYMEEMCSGDIDTMDEVMQYLHQRLNDKILGIDK